MLRIASLVIAIACAAAVAAAATWAGGAKTPKPFPDVIQLPTGFQPEGIEVGKGTTFFVGSVATGAIYRGDLRTGGGSILVPGVAGRSATGIELDSRNRLFVAGAATGSAYVYSAANGSLLRTYTFATAPTFINDVVVTHDAAYFTDSQRPVLYKVPIGAGSALGDAQTIPLSGDYVHVANAFNLNGIDATANGKTLVAVQTVNGKLYRIEPATGATKQISLGSESVPNGDGILLTGKTLYVVQNQQNTIAVISLAGDLGTGAGALLTRLTDSDFSVPTTIDDLGRRLYAVNARFGVADPATATYQVVQLRKPAVR
jgi:sugar lactone lactonase YvrE